MACFPKPSKGAPPFPRRPTEAECWDERRDCFWTCYVKDLAKHGYRADQGDFKKFFAELTYPSWNNILTSYQRLVSFIISGKEPQIPHDLLYDYANEKAW